MRHQNAPLLFLSVFLIAILFLGSACRERTGGDTVTIVTSDSFSGLDTLSATSSDAAADRIRVGPRDRPAVLDVVEVGRVAQPFVHGPRRAPLEHCCYLPYRW